MENPRAQFDVPLDRKLIPNKFLIYFRSIPRANLLLSFFFFFFFRARKLRANCAQSAGRLIKEKKRGSFLSSF